MRIRINSTPTFTEINGVQCRVWEGLTERGIPCYVFVHQIAVAESHDAAQFDEELLEQLPPPETLIRLKDVLP